MARSASWRRRDPRESGAATPAGSEERPDLVVLSGEEEPPLRELDAARLPDHIDRLYRAALGLCGTPHDAEDLVQETYARVLRKPRLLRHEDDAAYLLRALRNTWIGWRSSAHARRSVPLSPDRLEFVADPGADPQGSTLDARQAFAAVAELSPPLRETIVAVDVMGLSYREAARALRVRTGTVMSRLHRARESVATAVEGVAG